MRTYFIRTLSVFFGFFLVPGAAWGQLIEEFHPPKAECCLRRAAQRLADQLQDWAQLGRYHDDDQRLEALPAQSDRVVFLGDSITDGWNLTEFFPNKPYVNRGISGQTTPQMLLRMFPDVIDLHPAAVIILAGTNDIAGNTGPETLTMVEENMRAMTELAHKHGIKVILSALLPVSDYTATKQTTRRPPSDILKFNAWLGSYAKEAPAVFVDYYSALVDEQGMLKNGFSGDGLHPNARGYNVMARLAEAAIEKALH